VEVIAVGRSPGEGLPSEIAVDGRGYDRFDGRGYGGSTAMFQRWHVSPARGGAAAAAAGGGA
jgi:hypothetical protein